MPTELTGVAALLAGALEQERAGHVAAALLQAQVALAQAEAEGPPPLVATAAARLAYLRFRVGQYAEATRLAERALALASDDSPARVEALVVLGGTSAETHSLDQAERWLLQAAETARLHGLDSERGRALHNLAACVYLPRGQFDLSLAADREALRLADARSDRLAAVFPLITLTWTHWLQGDGDPARRHALRLRRNVPTGTTMEGWYHYLRAEIALEDGRPRRAEAALARARASAERSGDPGLSICVRLGMSRLRAVAADWGAAREWAEDALAWSGRIGYEHYRGLALLARAHARGAAGDPAEALDDLDAAIRLLADVSAHYDLALARLRQAGLLLAAGCAEADAAWARALKAISAGGHWALLAKERPSVLRLIAAFPPAGDAPPARASRIALTQLAQSAPPLLVDVLGRLRVFLGSRSRPVDATALRRRRGGELLALLLLAPDHSLHLETAAESLWPQRDPHARALLHHATSSLKRAVEPDLPDRFPSSYLLVEDGRLHLRLPPGSQVDVDALEELVSRRRWRQALGLCRGELLADWPDADWARGARERAHDLQVRALTGRMAELRDAGDLGSTLQIARRLLRFDPWNEVAAATAMAAAMALGDRPAALRIYGDAERALRQDLSLTPGTELQDLRQRCLQPEPGPAPPDVSRV